MRPIPTYPPSDSRPTPWDIGTSRGIFTGPGAEVIFTGSDSFEQQIVIDAEAGSAPNIAVFPQPGLASDMAARGLLHPLPAGMGDWVTDNYGAGSSWVALGTYPDKDGADQHYGFFYNVNVKSLVWYNPENFEDAGYEVPKTMEELKALTEHAGRHNRTATAGTLQIWINDKLLMRRSFPAGQQQPLVYHDLHQVMIPGVNTVKLVLSGDNEFPWSFDLGYHAEQPADDPDTAVELETQLASARVTEGESVALAVRVRNRTGDGLPMTMAIVGLPAGLHVTHGVLDDLKEAGDMRTAKEKGLIRLESKEYVVKDGDVIKFRFSV